MSWESLQKIQINTQRDLANATNLESKMKFEFKLYENFTKQMEQVIKEYVDFNQKSADRIVNLIGFNTLCDAIESTKITTEENITRDLYKMVNNSYKSDVVWVKNPDGTSTSTYPSAKETQNKTIALVFLLLKKHHPELSPKELKIEAAKLLAFRKSMIGSVASSWAKSAKEMVPFMQRSTTAATSAPTVKECVKNRNYALNTKHSIPSFVNKASLQKYGAEESKAFPSTGYKKSAAMRAEDYYKGGRKNVKGIPELIKYHLMEGVNIALDYNIDKISNYMNTALEKDAKVLFGKGWNYHVGGAGGSGEYNTDL